MRLRRKLHGLKPHTVELVTHLSCSADEAWEQVLTPRLLHHIASPLLRFLPHKETPFPVHWEEGEYRAWMLLFGFVPIGWQAIVISLPEAEGQMRFVRDNGFGPLISRWDHWIEISPENDGTRYVDRVTIDAGILTPLVSTFARVFYAHRQARWRALARSGFRALKL